MSDLKFAFSQLLKHPGFTAVAVLTLALGDGFIICFLEPQTEITQSKL